MAISNYPDLPMIRWGVFASRIRIRWAHGICPESFAPNPYRKLEMKKPMPKPATKKGKGKEKKGKC